MSFLLLAFLAGAVARAVGPRRRSWLVASLAAQATLFVLPPALLSSGVLQVHGQYDWVLVGLLAAGSGVQVAMVRASPAHDTGLAPSARAPSLISPSRASIPCRPARRATQSSQARCSRARSWTS